MRCVQGGLAMLHFPDRRLGSFVAHSCALTRVGSNWAVLLLGAGDCALAVQTVQLGVQLPALADAPRCTAVILL